MFTPDERTRLRDELVNSARADARITGAALTGSAAADRSDEWSDIDLALCVSDGADIDAVIDDWTDRMYRDHGAVHDVDVRAGRVLYRVFLLASTLQVDIAFAPADDFGATAATFRLLFGTAVDRPMTASPDPLVLAGMGWLYALHARSSIERGRAWQAEYMISGVRDHVLALACVRHGLPATQGRGMDDLPSGVAAPISRALVRSFDTRELRRAFRAAVEALLAEIGLVDASLASRLRGPMRELAR